MSKPKHGRSVLRILLLSLAALALTALRRERPRLDDTQATTPEPHVEPRLLDVPGWASSPAPARARSVRSRRRLATNLAFVALFFTGASFSAVAGDNVAGMLEGDGAETLAVAEAPAADEPATVPSGSVVEEPAEAEPAPPVEAAPAPAPAQEAAPAAEPAPVEAAPAAASPEPAASPEAPAQEAPVAEANADADASATPEVARVEQVAASVVPTRPRPAARTQKSKVVKGPVAPTAHVDPEVHEDHVSATVWLHRELRDPTPPSLRLAPQTASRLATAAKAENLDWAYLLAVLRADQGAVHVGSRRALQGRRPSLAQSAGRLAYLRVGATRKEAALAFTGDAKAADRAVALAKFYRAVGLQTLVDGLLSRQDALEEKVLADERVTLYAGGRADIEAGRVNVRILALVEYLAETYGQVTVSSLISGHRLYSRPGVISMHIYGEAVDIAALAGLPIAGHQEPGGLTERAVRDILLLPAEMLPRQVISLLGLGGPSFPLADHDDHIHVGF